MQGLRHALAALALAASQAAFGQAYPAKPVKFVVPYPPGASTDTVARAVAQKLSDTMGQQVFVENRAGASGNIGADYVAKSPPDGYTILLGTDATHTTNVFFGKNFPYDPVRDFTPITLAVGNVIVLASHPSVPATSMRELIDYAKQNPGRLAYASSGTGSPHHLSGELLRQMAGIDIVHVPYKGGGQAITDFVGGQVPLMFSSLVTVAPHIRSGKVRALGVVESTRYARCPRSRPSPRRCPGSRSTPGSASSARRGSRRRSRRGCTARSSRRSTRRTCAPGSSPPGWSWSPTPRPSSPRSSRPTSTGAGG
jgi:tripartite-type tricarboxylate transporter receptor subunit TctC